MTIMKAYAIDWERVEGMILSGTTIEFQGAMTVREPSEPLEGVYQSSLFIDLEQAAKLHGMLGRALERARQEGWKPQQRQP